MQTKPFFILAALISAVIFTSTTSHAVAQQQKIVVGMYIIAPWKMEIEGQLQGAEVELWNSIAEKLKMDIEYRVLPFPRLLQDMKSGVVDISSGILRKPAREAFLDFIEPAYKNKSNKAFYVPKGKGKHYNTLDDFHGKTVGIRKKSAFFAAFDQNNNIHKHPVKQPSQLIDMLISGRLDAFAMTDSEADYLLLHNPTQGQVERANYMYAKPNPVYITIAKQSSLPHKIINAIKALIIDMTTSGEAHAIMDGYFRDIGIPIPDYK